MMKRVFWSKENEKGGDVQLYFGWNSLLFRFPEAV